MEEQITILYIDAALFRAFLLRQVRGGNREWVPDTVGILLEEWLHNSGHLRRCEVGAVLRGQQILEVLSLYHRTRPIPDWKTLEEFHYWVVLDLEEAKTQVEKQGAENVPFWGIIESSLERAAMACSPLSKPDV